MARESLRESRVARMHMRVRASGVDAATVPRLREQLERRFAIAVLDACEREVHRQLGPDALVFVRRIEQRWTLRHDELDSAALIDRLGEQLGVDLVAGARTGHPPRPTDAAVVFADLSHYRATYLGALASADELLAKAWYFAELRGRDPLLDSAREGADAVRRLIAALLELDVLEVVVARAPEAVRRSLASVVAPSEWPISEPSRARVLLWLERATDGSDERASADVERAAVTAELDVSTDEPPSLLRTPPTRASEHQPEPAAPPITAREVAGQRDPVTDRDRAVERASASEHATATARASLVVARTDRTDRTDRADSPPHERPPSEPTHLQPHPALTRQPPTATPEPTAIVRPGTATAWAGLFYLPARVLELELGSHLWEAGVDEGSFLAALARHLAGVEVGHDPAPRVLGFGFAATERRLDSIPGWAIDEIVGKLERSLAASWARHRLTGEPPPLRTADDPLEDHELAWLATLAPDRPTASVLAAAGAAVRARMLATLDRPDTLATLRPSLRVPGRIELAPGGAIEIHIPMAHVDVELRRAALDFNPGWLPWLETKLDLVFDPGRDESW